MKKPSLRRWQETGGFYREGPRWDYALAVPQSAPSPCLLPGRTTALAASVGRARRPTGRAAALAARAVRAGRPAAGRAPASSPCLCARLLAALGRAGCAWLRRRAGRARSQPVLARCPCSLEPLRSSLAQAAVASRRPR